MTLGGWTAIAIGIAAAVAVGAAGAEPETVAPSELAALVSAENGPLLLDVRTPEEFARGHVPGALLIPVQELPDMLHQIEAYKERGVVAYCERGGRAERALDILEAAGFENLALLEGSMQRWRSEMAPETAPE